MSQGPVTCCSGLRDEACLGGLGQLLWPDCLSPPCPPFRQHPFGCAEQQPDPLEEAAAAAVSHQPAPPSAGQRACPPLRLAAGEPPLAPPSPPLRGWRSKGRDPGGLWAQLSPTSLFFSPPHARSSTFVLFLPFVLCTCLSNLCLSSWLPLPRHSLLPDHPVPLSHSGSPFSLLCFSLPVPLSQVSRIAAYAYSALSQIRVDAKEELVVQFGIP